MTPPPEWVMALSFLTSCEADAAIEQGDAESVNYLHALSDRAAGMAGRTKSKKDAAWMGMRRWIESRSLPASDASSVSPSVSPTWADLGI